jgi:membrane peptidoglycan carboxypeptidase
MAGLVTAALMFPFAGGFGLLSNRASDVVANGSAQLVEGNVPQVSTMVDAAGNPIAWLYTQRRFEVASDQIANTIKLAVVSIEDKRFADHNGVDWQGTLTGLSGYISGNLSTRGGSTIEQQYVKNFQLLVTAQTDAERRAAVELTPARKLREMRMALTLDKTFTKAEILTRYLNLVGFGNGAFGVQDAAQTYFGVDASQLNWQQAALAGRHGSVAHLTGALHQSPRRAAAAKCGVGHHDRESSSASGSVARRQGRAAGRAAPAESAAWWLHRRTREWFLL